VAVVLEDMRVPCSSITLRAACVMSYTSYINKR
jgi:hypothetical protein